MSPDDERQSPSAASVGFEDLLAELSAHFINLPADQVDSEIESAQKLICERLNLDRSTLWQLQGPDRDLLLLSHHHPNELPVLPGTNALESLPWLAAKVLRGDDILVHDLDDLPADAARDKALLRQVNTRSSAILPVVAAGSMVGCLTFATTRETRYWTAPLVKRFRLIAQIFANALERQRADLALRQALEEVERLKDRLQQENLYLRQEVKGLHGRDPIFGESAAIRLALAQAEQVAPTSSTVLLLGETGSGKERFASFIHDRSPRHARAMVRVNCSAIPDALIESELFGREKGAYTGALSRQIGRFELASGSTIFLDEIGDLPPDVQVKLLRVLEEKQIERLGSPRPVPVDVRIIAATNQDLEKAVRDGAFRQDLYYRLNVFPLTVPPLRERVEDIPLLVRTFVEEFATAMGKRIESIPRASVEALVRYAWPGNVRELRNVIERAMILASGPTLRIDLPSLGPGASASQQLRGVERDHILGVLNRANWRIRGANGAAETLGMKPSTLESRMKKLGIRRASS
jgi:transcriptional regulator with GAF, ATPase, and Fis domain